MRTIQKKMIGCLVFLASSAWGAEIKGVVFPDNKQVGGQTLVLNGAGLRTATWLGISVYAGALYLREQLGSAEGILASPGPKVLEMAFLRDVDASDIRKTWDKSFADNCESDCENGKKHLETLKAWFKDVKKGDHFTYTFERGTVTVAAKDEVLGKIENADFSRNVLATWLGKKPASERLKAGLLGQPGN